MSWQLAFVMPTDLPIHTLGCLQTWALDDFLFIGCDRKPMYNQTSVAAVSSRAATPKCGRTRLGYARGKPFRISYSARTSAARSCAYCTYILQVRRAHRVCEPKRRAAIHVRPRESRLHRRGPPVRRGGQLRRLLRREQCLLQERALAQADLDVRRQHHRSSRLNMSRASP